MLYGQGFPFFLPLAVWTAFGLTRSSRQPVGIRCSISKLYVPSISIHLATCPSGDLKFSNQRRAPWSVLILK